MTEHIRRAAVSPRIAWVAPVTSTGRARFPAAQASWQSLGVSALEYCDIDEEADESQLVRLHEYDVIYLTGGEPLGFLQNIRRRGVSARLLDCLAADRLVIAASGGAMQLTTNVSLFRLLSSSVDEVVAERDEYHALGIVEYEMLPHLNRHPPPFIEKVERYSARVAHDIIALEDGAALVHAKDGAYSCLGRAVRFRGGTHTAFEATA